MIFVVLIIRFVSLVLDDVRSLETRGEVAVPDDFKHRIYLLLSLLLLLTLTLDLLQYLPQLLPAHHIFPTITLTSSIEDSLNDLLQVSLAHFRQFLAH